MKDQVKRLKEGLKVMENDREVCEEHSERFEEISAKESEELPEGSVVKPDKYLLESISTNKRRNN